MLGRFTAASGSYAASIFALAGAAQAQPPAPAPAAAAEPAVLWYRSTGECPDGAGFLTRVGDRAAAVRLAEAGDRVDFVVNLSMTPEGARGRLERETEGGTVAIREVVDASCERAADVIALNLALALAPERPAGEPVPEPATSPTPKTSEPVETEQETEVRVPRAGSTPPPAKPQPQPVPEAAPAQPEPDRWRVGAQGGVLSGMSPELMARGTAFVELGGALPPPLADVTFRVAAVGAFGSSDTDSGTVEQSLWAARLDVCPLALGGPVVSLKPCAAGELGQLRASYAQSASASWAALGVHARGQWIVGSSVAIEGEVGAAFPLQRYDVSAGSTVLYSSAPAGLSAAIGTSIGFW
ncbi:MAG TPA: hypothetical protein VFU02_06770 [Polyangiaceae bacterium]|nr:hypothetical protein [Polyangiaceae bacterium]